MSNTFLVFEKTSWWLLPVVLAALMFAAIPYAKAKYPWSSAFSVVLAALRFAGSFLILILLLDPLLRRVINHTEQPVISIIMDNSLSVAMMTDSTDKAKILHELFALQDKWGEDVQLDFMTLTDEDGWAEVSYSAEESNLSRAINRTLEKNDGKNLAGLVLITDGIYNKGLAPGYLKYPKPVIAVGLGDTIAPKDVAIQSVRANAVAYQGNKFPIEVIIDIDGYENARPLVTLVKSGRVIDTKRGENRSKLLFEVEADSPGLNRYVVRVEELKQEISYANNLSNIYVEVIEGKERILIVAPSPHPDIAAIRRAIAQSDHYETELYIPAISENAPSGDYDVVIAHHAFSPNFPKLDLSGSPAKWYILGKDSDLGSVSERTGLSIIAFGNEKDRVKAAFNPVFSAFELDRDEIEVFSGFTPITVPFGEYELSGSAQTLIYQQVGSMITAKPLLFVYNDSDHKSAVLAGPGIWKWRILEGTQQGTTDGFDQIITKLVRYLSVKSDKRRFIFAPVKGNFDRNESVRFNAELYNETYEKVYENGIFVSLTDEQGGGKAFEYYAREGDDGLNIGILEEGVYRFAAYTSYGGQTFNVGGDFVVEQTNLESLNLTADHTVLREIVRKSGGSFLHIDEMNDLEEAVDRLGAKGLIRSSERFLPLPDSVVMFLIIVALFSSEWFLRKYMGSY